MKPFPGMYKTFCTLRMVSNEAGRVHPISEHIFAVNQATAEVLCDLLGRDYDDELLETIEAPEMDGFCDDIQRQQDKEWAIL